MPTQRGLHRKHIVEACHDALKRLRVDYLDLYFCHRPDKQTPMEETVWTMHQLIQQGKILYWGTSEWSAAEIMDAHRIAERHHLIGPVTEQPQYNMFVRRKVEVEYQDVYRTVGLGTTGAPSPRSPDWEIQCGRPCRRPPQARRAELAGGHLCSTKRTSPRWSASATSQ